MMSLHTPGTPGMGSKGHFVFFSISDAVAYQIKVEEVQGNTEFTHTLDLWGWVLRSDIEIVQM